MPAVTRLGDLNTGHDSCSPVPLVSGSPNVFVNGKPVGRVGDSYEAHGCITHASHSGVIASGSSTVFVNGIPVGRIGDPVSCGGTVAQGSSNVIVDEGGVTAEKCANLAFNCVKKWIEASPLLTEVDETIISLPAICKNMAENIIQDPNNKQGWNYLPDMFVKWISNRAYDSSTKSLDSVDAPKPFYIDWDWFYSFSIAKKKVSLLLDGEDALIFNKNAQNELINILKRDYQALWDSKQNFSFDYTKSKWYDLQKNYFTMVSISQFDAINLDAPFTEVNGLFAALASCSIRTLAKGQVVFNGDKAIIKISNVGLFVRDSINFAETDWFFGPVNLGRIKDIVWAWDRKKLIFAVNPLSSSSVFLENYDFNSFRKKYNVGMDYLVLSNIHELQYETEFYIGD